MKHETESIINKLEIENANLRSRCEKLERERDGLSLLRDHLEEEIGKFRTRCEKLEQENDKLGEIVLDRGCTKVVADCTRLETERDEARKWALKFRWENKRLLKKILMQQDELMILYPRAEMRDETIDDLHSQVKHWQSLYSKEHTRHHERLKRVSSLETLRDELNDEIRKLRTQLASIRDLQDKLLADTHERHTEETDWLRTQLTTARNDALDEARAECTKIFAETIHIEAHKMLVRVIEILRALKTTTKE